MYLELPEEMDDFEDLSEILANAHLNTHFLSLGREVRRPSFIQGPFAIDEWPNDITSGWKYASNVWHEAGNDFIIEGKSISFLSLLQNKALK